MNWLDFTCNQTRESLPKVGGWEKRHEPSHAPILRRARREAEYGMGGGGMFLCTIRALALDLLVVGCSINHAI